MWGLGPGWVVATVLSVLILSLAATLLYAWCRCSKGPSTDRCTSRWLERCCGLRRSPRWMLAWHVFNLIWFTGFAVQGWFCDGRKHAVEVRCDGELNLPIHYTPLAFRMQPLFWLAATLHNAACLSSERAGRLVPVMHALALNAFELVLPVAWLVSVVVFFLLSPFSPVIFTEIDHFWNTVCLTVELAANDALVIRASRACLIILWSSAYVAMVWARRAQDPERWSWPYFFMKLDGGSAIGWYALLLMLHFGVYAALVRISHKWRDGLACSSACRMYREYVGHEAGDTRTGGGAPPRALASPV